jgi:hypothetical protein
MVPRFVLFKGGNGLLEMLRADSLPLPISPCPKEYPPEKKEKTNAIILKDKALFCMERN